MRFRASPIDASRILFSLTVNRGFFADDVLKIDRWWHEYARRSRSKGVTMDITGASIIGSQISAIVLATGSLREVGQFVAEWAWDIWWALVLGFTISGVIQAYVSQERMVDLLGGRGTP